MHRLSAVKGNDMKNRKQKLGMLQKHLNAANEQFERESALYDPEDEESRFSLYLLRKESEARQALIYAVAVMNGIPMKTADRYFAPDVSGTGRKLFADYTYRELNLCRVTFNELH